MTIDLTTLYFKANLAKFIVRGLGGKRGIGCAGLNNIQQQHLDAALEQDSHSKRDLQLSIRSLFAICFQWACQVNLPLKAKLGPLCVPR